MNAERLLAHFEQISEAPDAVARLRRFILDLAVRGKLVEQDPEDEPVDLLLDEIKSRMKMLRLKHAFSTIDPLETPFDKPSGWSWCRLGEVCEKTGSGSTPRGGKDVYKSSGVPFLRSQNIYNEGLRLDDVAFIDAQTHERMAGTRVLPCDLLLNITGGSIGRCAKVPLDFGEANVSQHVAIIRVAARGTEEFLHSLILSPYFQGFVDKSQTGAGRGGLPKNRMDAIPIPLPPLAEQHRIVAKVDELMALCDQLEASRQQREQHRERLVAASLQRLNQPAEDPATAQNDARFALQVLPSITATPAQIKQLRQTILNLAVRGKLVEQDPEDEPIRDFIGDTGYQLAPKWSIPGSWKWVHLTDLGRLRGGGTPSKAHDDFWDGDIPWVSPKDMKVDYVDDAQLSITQVAIENSAVNLIRPNSILFVVRGMILAHSFPVAISKVPLTINQDMKALVLHNAEMAEYLLRALKGLKPEMLMKVQRSSHGTCRIEGKDYREFPIPLPPLAEQHRIVAKVEELMALCDQLEQQLGQADQQRRRLLEAVLAEALREPEKDLASMGSA